ncbi:MAG: fumarylacetoacetase [Fimbriimonadaceae bacterium]
MHIVPASLQTWLEVPQGSPFTIQNVPLGVGLIDDAEAVLTRIGNWAINVSVLIDEGLLPENLALAQGDLEIEPDEAGELRRALVELFDADAKRLRDNARLRQTVVVPVVAVEMLLPMPIGAFVDFYSGINHATNVGRMFRPDMPPLLPNYRHLPVAYNGRASSIVVSGSPIIRPMGQTMAPGADAPTFGPTRELDFELEIGVLIGRQSDHGRPVPIEEAEAFILGYVLVNDWSARDIQRWEYQPLGPFLSKSFATSISPWIVLKDALEPFRCLGPVQDPIPLPHLRPPGAGHYDIALEAALLTEAAHAQTVLTRTSTRELYWSAAQQIAHQTSNGTPLEPGDLLASGTISGDSEGTYGSLLELTWRGAKPLTLPETGETRTFLEDGDTVILSGGCEKDGARIGFGDVSGIVLPAGSTLR